MAPSQSQGVTGGPIVTGNLDAVARVLDAAPHVFNHNMETVSRLYKRVRPQANYRQSLDVLRFAKHYRPESLTKSGAMAGLGETESEVQELLRDLRTSKVDVATLGQYLQPARRNLPVVVSNAGSRHGSSMPMPMV